MRKTSIAKLQQVFKEFTMKKKHSCPEENPVYFRFHNAKLKVGRPDV